MSHIFISYSGHDRKKVETLARKLEEHGWSVWFDKSILPGSASPFVEIEKQIGLAKCVLVLWSKNSVRSKSVKAEAEEALGQDKLIPVIIDPEFADRDERIPLQFRRFPAARLAGQKGSKARAEFEKLLSAIKRHLNPSIIDPPPVSPNLDLKVIGRWNVKLALALAAFSLITYALLTVVPTDNPGIGWNWEGEGTTGEGWAAKVTWVTPSGPAVNVLEEGDQLLRIGPHDQLTGASAVREAIKSIKKATNDDDEARRLEKREDDRIKKEEEEGKLKTEGEKQRGAERSIKKRTSGLHYTTVVARGEDKLTLLLLSPRSAADGLNNFVLPVCHVLLIVIFLLMIFERGAEPRRSKVTLSRDEARITFCQFIKGWTAVWTTWLVLYLFMAGFSLLPSGVEACEPCYGSGIDFLNISNSVAFFYMFLVLDMKSVPARKTRGAKGQPPRDEAFRKALNWIYAISSLIFILSALGRFRVFGLTEVGPFLSGFLVAISMAFLFGRLDSHYINVDRRYLVPLYFYAVVQVIGPVLIELKIGVYQTIFFILVLVLKVILFFVFYRWQKEGLFEEYIEKATTSVEGNGKPSAA